MTTYYARSSMTSLSNGSDWSLTSGGPSAGVTPGTSDTAIFDANSGVSRTINGTLSCNSLSMGASAFMTFIGNVTIRSSSTINAQFNADLKLGSNGSTTSLTATAATRVNKLDVSASTSGVNSIWKLYSDLWVTGNTTIYGGNSSADAQLFLNGYTLYTNSFRLATLSASFTNTKVFAENGTLDITGSVGVAPYNEVFVVDEYPTLSMGTGTLRFSDKTATVKEAKHVGDKSTLSTTLGNVVNNTGNNLGSSQLKWTHGANYYFASYDCGKGAVNIFPATYTMNSLAWTMNGAGSVTAICSSVATSRVNLKLNAGGVIDAYYCSFKDVNMVASAPATTVRALNCTDLGNNVGITFMKVISNFLSFF